MDPAARQIFQQIDALIPNELRHQPGKSPGLVVRPGVHGAYLCSVDIFGNELNFTSPQRAWITSVLATKFPHMDLRSVLARSSESNRRFNSIAKRLESAQASLKNGTVIALESLDFQGVHPRLNLDPSQLAAERPRDITRGFTFVALEPAPPRRVIVLSDLPLFDPILKKTIIPDEIVISYEISTDELKAVRSAKPPATFKPFYLISQASKIAKDLKITCGDINKELVGEALIEHFNKTMRGLIAAAHAAVERFGLTPVGSILCNAIDSFLHSGMARINDEEYASFVRKSAKGTKVGVCVELSSSVEEGKVKIAQRSVTPNFSKKVSIQVRKKLIPAMTTTAAILEKVLSRR